MTHGTGQLLFDEAPIAVSPSLVRLFGLPEATLLQQVHFRIWCKRGDPAQYAAHFIEGRYWVHWTMAELQRAVPLGATSSDPYKRVIRGLQALGILLVEQHRRSQWDRTNWYSIDYEALERYVAAHGDSGGGPTGGNATNRDTAFPSIDQRRSAASTRGDSATHSQSKSSSKTSNETTTTTPAPKPAEKLASGGGGVQDDPGELDLTALPAGLHLGVSDLVRPRTDAQRFVDLLAARLKRDVDLPAPRQLKNPLLWLRSLMVGEGVIDFCEADRLSDERDRSAATLRCNGASAAAELEAQLAKDATHRTRRENAQSLLAGLTVAERDALKAKVLAGTLPASKRKQVIESIDAGTLPSSPVALHPTIRALEAIRQQQPGGPT